MGSKRNEILLINGEDLKELKKSATFKDYASQIKDKPVNIYTELQVVTGKSNAKAIKERLLSEEENIHAKTCASKLRGTGSKPNKNKNPGNNILVDSQHFKAIQGQIEAVRAKCAISAKIQPSGNFLVILLDPSSSKMVLAKEQILAILELPYNQSSRGAPSQAMNTGGGTSQSMHLTDHMDSRVQAKSDSIWVSDFYLFRYILIEKRDAETRSRFRNFEQYFKVEIQYRYYTTQKFTSKIWHTLDICPQSALTRENVHEIFENIFLKYALEIYNRESFNAYPYDSQRVQMYQCEMFTIDYQDFKSRHGTALQRFLSHFGAQLIVNPYQKEPYRILSLQPDKRMNPKDVGYMNMVFENILLRYRVRRILQPQHWKDGRVV